MPELYSVPTYTMHDIFGNSISREDALALIQSEPEAFSKFEPLSVKSKDKILSFIQGNSGLKILNDKCFLLIMNPALYPERLNSMLSAILGEQICVRDTLLSQESIVTGKNVLTLLHTLAELEDNTLCNIVILSAKPSFSSAETACYLSNLVVQQYNSLSLNKKQCLDCDSIKPTILFIFMEHSPLHFTAVSPHYIHRERISYNSNVLIKPLTHTIYISCDIFHSVVQDINTELSAWLTFLSSDSPTDIVKLVNSYPKFLNYYHELLEFRKNPKELISMHSEIPSQSK